MRGGGSVSQSGETRGGQETGVFSAEFLTGFDDIVPRTMLSYEDAKVKLDSAGQGHVLRFWPELSAEDRDAFLRELSQLEPGELVRHCRGAAEAARQSAGEEERLCGRMEPVEREFIGGVRRSDPDSLQEWEEEGPALLTYYLYSTLIMDVCFWCIYDFLIFLTRSKK